MHLSTLSDVRAEIARRKLKHHEVAESMGRTPYSLSHLMAWDEEVQLTPRGVEKFTNAIEQASAEREKQKAVA